jgi:hypothetical protein
MDGTGHAKLRDYVTGVAVLQEKKRQKLLLRRGQKIVCS